MKCKHEFRFVAKGWGDGHNFFYCVHCLKIINEEDAKMDNSAQEEGQ